jgi:hypothetical protein
VLHYDQCPLQVQAFITHIRKQHQLSKATMDFEHYVRCNLHEITQTDIDKAIKHHPPLHSFLLYDHLEQEAEQWCHNLLYKHNLQLFEFDRRTQFQTCKIHDLLHGRRKDATILFSYPSFFVPKTPNEAFAQDLFNSMYNVLSFGNEAERQRIRTHAKYVVQYNLNGWWKVGILAFLNEKQKTCELYDSIIATVDVKNDMHVQVLASLYHHVDVKCKKQIQSVFRSCLASNCFSQITLLRVMLAMCTQM